MKLTDLKPGMIVVTDNGFTCVKAGEHVVQADEDGDLFIECCDGNHLLDGQIGKDGELIGLSKPETYPVLIHLTMKEFTTLSAIFGVIETDPNENGAIAGKFKEVVDGIIGNIGVTG
ncbi:hypothetical protein PXK56_18330 [Phaeobacter gallaeciensis]|uniref:hypothetical protein n=1 Tax=Phaeobacter gallaeciensis TaxID=60890 RepID=UPI0023809904|nr:hypothetical protein [Phaeobacter gallaeciensis]MDE4297145.1 hypothetical protein [Phaeobacter gallaeciensis]